MLPIVIPLGKPQQIEQPIAPIETRARPSPRRARTGTIGTSPRRRCGIHGNTYLVGTCGISSILITGSDGDILIDGGTEAGADLIARQYPQARVSARRDVKILLNSHEHFDHVGGIARLQQLTGAQLFASAGGCRGAQDAAPPARAIRRRDRSSPFPPARVDRIIR